MTCVVPAIYAPKEPAGKLSLPGRLLAAFIAGCCLSVLIVARILPPNPAGVGTHAGLGLHRCEFLDRTGIPCPSCGMTTSFSQFVRGHWLESVYVQPMGFFLAILTAAAFWIALYVASTGNPAWRLIRFLPARYYFLPLMFLGVAAWGWKIFIHLRGIDGW